MTVYIHREKRFNKLLEGLRKGRQEAALASVRADAIIHDLTTSRKFGRQMTEKRTKKGELRIHKCLKYDLGSGYRLICIEQEGHLIVTYVGTHDDCDRWIENNRRFEPELGETGEEISLTEEDERDENQPPGSDHDMNEEVDYDDVLMKRINEKILRRIFCGLAGR